MGISMFDILGPITIGPSSSHTAGAVRIGLVARTLVGGELKQATITFYGSFADTYRGHGTDKAILGGLLGFSTENEKVRDSVAIAEFRGFKYEFRTAEEPRYHPNTVLIEAVGKNDHQVRLRGASVGGGAIRLTELNGSEIEASCIYDTMIVFHKDEPGVLAAIAKTLSLNGYNIGNLRLSRTRREGDVITIIETDIPVDSDTEKLLYAVNSVSNVVSIPKF